MIEKQRDLPYIISKEKQELDDIFDTDMRTIDDIAMVLSALTVNCREISESGKKWTPANSNNWSERDINTLRKTYEEAMRYCVTVLRGEALRMEKIVADNSDLMYKKLPKGYNIPVYIYHFSEDVLAVKLPVLMSRNGGKMIKNPVSGKYMTEDIGLAFKDKKSEIKTFNTADNGYTFHYVKIKKKPDSKMIDNDNYDTKYITDKICSELGISDRANIVSFCYNTYFVPDYEEANHLIITRDKDVFQGKEELMKYIDLYEKDVEKKAMIYSEKCAEKR